MDADRMRVRVLVPFGVVADHADVSRVVAETPQGSFGFWPHRLDGVAALVAGILTFESDAGGTVFVAIDAGVLVKTGAEVRISVRRAVVGNDLARLRETVEHAFTTLDDRQRSSLATMARVEADLMRRFADLGHA